LEDSFQGPPSPIPKIVGSIFKTIGRDHPMIQRAQFGDKMMNLNYHPNFEAVKPRNSCYVSLEAKPSTEPREKILRVPLCLAAAPDYSCSFEVRKTLRDKQREADRNKRQIAGLDATESWAVLPPPVVQVRYIDESRKYANQPRGLGFALQSERKNVLEHNPYPGQDCFAPPRASPGRFDTNTCDLLDLLAYRRDTSKGPELEKYSARKEPRETFRPDANHYQHVFQQDFEKQGSLELGAMAFSKRPVRPPLFKEEPLKCLEYDSTLILKGEEAIKALQAKGSVNFSTQSKRDLGMYNFKKDEISTFERHALRPRERLMFSDVIPIHLAPMSISIDTEARRPTGGVPSILGLKPSLASARVASLHHTNPFLNRNSAQLGAE
jgi:hypothetical protein